MMAATIRWFWTMFERSNIPCGTNGELRDLPMPVTSRNRVGTCCSTVTHVMIKAICFGVAARRVEVGGGMIGARLQSRRCWTVESGGLPPTRWGTTEAIRHPAGGHASFPELGYSHAFPNKVRSCRASDTTVWWGKYGKQKMLAPPLCQ